MAEFVRHSGLVVPLDRINVDTDLIIPKQFLKSIQRTGFGVHLFDSLRYLDEGVLGQDCAQRELNSTFPLNEPRYRDASILLSGANFGCGSSREHAAWALLEYGFRCVIAPSFSDIFYNNCVNNGLLPVVLAEAEVAVLMQRAAATPLRLCVDLAARCVSVGEEGASSEHWDFEIDDFRRDCLLRGVDDIALSLEQEEAIRAFEARRLREAPWLYATPASSAAASVPPRS